MPVLMKNLRFGLLFPALAAALIALTPVPASAQAKTKASPVEVDEVREDTLTQTAPFNGSKKAPSSPGFPTIVSGQSGSSRPPK